MSALSPLPLFSRRGSHLAAVCNLHISCRHGDPLLGKLLLKKVPRGILHYQGHTRVLRQPVTPRVLLTTCPIKLSWLGARDFSMIWAASTLAFFCFLRCSEFTYQGVSRFRPQFDLSADCVLFHPSLASPRQMSIILKSSKTNVFREGHRLLIPCSPSSLCAVSAMHSYFLSTCPRRPLLLLEIATIAACNFLFYDKQSVVTFLLCISMIYTPDSF